MNIAHEHRVYALAVTLLLVLGIAPWASANAATFLAFRPASGPAQAAAVSPEGCTLETGSPRGELAADGGSACGSWALVDREYCGRGGLVPWAPDCGVAPGTAFEGVFSSSPLAQGMQLGGRARLVIHYVNEAAPGYLGDNFRFELRELTSAGAARLIADQDIDASESARYEVDFDVPDTFVAAGSRIEVAFGSTQDPSRLRARLLFGGEYGDAGITLGVGGDASKSDVMGLATLPAALLAPLLLAGLLRRRPTRL